MAGRGQGQRTDLAGRSSITPRTRPGRAGAITEPQPQTETQSGSHRSLLHKLVRSLRMSLLHSAVAVGRELRWRIGLRVSRCSLRNHARIKSRGRAGDFAVRAGLLFWGAPGHSADPLHVDHRLQNRLEDPDIVALNYDFLGWRLFSRDLAIAFSSFRNPLSKPRLNLFATRKIRALRPVAQFPRFCVERE